MKIKTIFTFVLFLSGIIILSIPAIGLADITLPSIISDNMVLQQQSKVPIWGWAEPGEKVTVKTSWQNSRSYHAKADDNDKWTVKIDTPTAGGPYTINITGQNKISLNNILIGEVWICSGQSNMRWTVQNSDRPGAEIAAADYPNIRLFDVPMKAAGSPQQNCGGQWKLCSPNSISEFSAVAYFFGREIHQQLDVPVGLVLSCWGGTPAEAWTKKQALESNPDLVPILERYQKALKVYPQKYEEYQKALKEHKQKVRQANAEGKKPPRAPSLPMGPENSWSPSGLYNAMIYPLIPYTIKGSIWYQGESNHLRAYQYRKLFPAMIKNWRDDWAQGDFPFYYVQIAPWHYANPTGTTSAELREAQLMTLSVPHTGMAVTMDIGNLDNIHPKNKQDVGKRLSLWALAKTYGKKNIVYSGPIYKSMKIEGNKIRLFFDFIGKGLTGKGYTPWNKGPLTYFTIADKDRKFVDAEAVIDGDTIVVSSPLVKKPVAVRYAWSNAPIPNFFNKDGLPASPFRTDDWQGMTFKER